MFLEKAVIYNVRTERSPLWIDAYFYLTALRPHCILFVLLDSTFYKIINVYKLVKSQNWNGKVKSSSSRRREFRGMMGTYVRRSEHEMKRNAEIGIFTKPSILLANNLYNSEAWYEANFQSIFYNFFCTLPAIPSPNRHGQCRWHPQTCICRQFLSWNTCRVNGFN